MPGLAPGIFLLTAPASPPRNERGNARALAGELFQESGLAVARRGEAAARAVRPAAVPIGAVEPRPGPARGRGLVEGGAVGRDGLFERREQGRVHTAQFSWAARRCIPR